jgi:hypothetical protein
MNDYHEDARPIVTRHQILSQPNASPTPALSHYLGETRHDCWLAYLSLVWRREARGREVNNRRLRWRFDGGLKGQFELRPMELKRARCLFW